MLTKDVVVVGGRRLQKYWERLGKNVHLLDYMDDTALEILYKNAFIFMYPSLNEGFGCPPLEAMKYGTPVIASAISSIPEVCGDAVAYINPYDISEYANRLLMLMNDPIEYGNYSRKGIERFRYISEKQDEMLDLMVCDILEEKPSTRTVKDGLLMDSVK